MSELKMETNLIRQWRVWEYFCKNAKLHWIVSTHDIRRWIDEGIQNWETKESSNGKLIIEQK